MFEFRFFEIYRSKQYLDLILDGVLVTGSLTIFSSIMAFLMAIFIAALRYWRIPVLGKFLATYVEFIRNTPLIVQLFFFAFGLPALLSYIWPFWCHALLALTVNFSGYFSAILYSGFLKIPRGQIEAAKSIGLKNLVIFKHVILPQTLHAMYPALCSQFIFVFLTTGVISEIGVVDLTHAGLFIDSRTFRSFEIFIVLTALYVFMALSFKFFLNLIFLKKLKPKY
ncbi:MAG: amino acid ABC transporter permease [Rhodospirillaceae bacterium TMED8]|nr:amino acid ABC transporter permease [Magnetovibrio sp.]OUT50921.1 MAG: amino acid ABC transporter permease [Rhodospirillaceae bacterium TMED8]